LPKTALALVLSSSITLGANGTSAQEKPVQAGPGALQQQPPTNSNPRQSLPSEQSQQPTEHEHPKLADGCAVQLKFRHDVQASRVIAGEKIPLEVVEPVKVGSLLVISEHAVAEATVTLAQPKGTVGHGGNLELRIDSVVLADGERVPLRAVRDVHGGDRSPVMVQTLASAGFIGGYASPLVFLFYVKGKDAMIPAGTVITAYIQGDFPLDAAKWERAAPASQERQTQ